MLKIFTWFKEKMLLVLTGVVGVLMLYINIQSRMRSKEKQKQLEGKIKQKEKLSKAKQNAVDTMVEGLENEKKPVNRGYFDADGQ
jgi:hypothetical protein